MNTNPIKLISNYRSALMGIAILAVLVGHFVALSDMEHGYIRQVLSAFSLLIFTEGFLFLSGFGLYYSFSKNHDIKGFYKKRVLRLLIPYLILSGWYFVIFDLIIDHNPLNFFGHISSTAFWWQGNFCGMWYIALSVVLYLLYPFIHLAMFDRANKFRPGIFVLLIGLSWLINYLLATFDPQYYSKVEIALNKVPCFLIGAVCGYYSLKPAVSKGLIWGVVGVLVLLSLGGIVMPQIIWPFSNIPIKILSLILCVVMLILLERIVKSNKIIQILGWLGEYTLELYVLHLLIFNCLSHVMSGYWQVSLMIVGAFLLMIPFKKFINKIVDKTQNR